MAPSALHSRGAGPDSSEHAFVNVARTSANASTRKASRIGRFIRSAEGAVRLTPAHKELIKILAEAAVEEFLEELQSQEEKRMETGERHATHSDY